MKYLILTVVLSTVVGCTSTQPQAQTHSLQKASEACFNGNLVAYEERSLNTSLRVVCK